ncbi:hypothetical protein ANN_24506 [Periplaneta americana]|uniref:DDE Tnp4 domain-containing protein n=1 Tax=Periplaneta americana TaxID=6978 RepID=A0ABQ8S378_PERAM|nr:hypothetical protein ANN_24506 [Periplaneta americana]
MAGLCEGGNEPSGSLKAICKLKSEARRKEKGYYSALITRHLINDEVRLKEFFRLTRYQFHQVLNLIQDDIQSQPCNRVRKPITSFEKLAITLRFFATGESYRSLMFGFRISHSYISVFVPQVLDVICKKLTSVYLPPTSTINFEVKGEEFWKKWNFPNLIAAIDGKHVGIMCPDKSGSLDFNYKSFFFIVLLALVDPNYKFLVVDRSMMEVYRRKRAVFAYLVYKNYLKRTERRFWEHPLVAKRFLQVRKCLISLLLNATKFRHSLMSLGRVFHRRESEIVYDDEYDDDLVFASIRLFCVRVKRL